MRFFRARGSPELRKVALHQSTWWCGPRPRLGWVEMVVGLPEGPSYFGHFPSFIFHCSRSFLENYFLFLQQFLLTCIVINWQVQRVAFITIACSFARHFNILSSTKLNLAYPAEICQQRPAFVSCDSFLTNTDKRSREMYNLRIFCTHSQGAQFKEKQSTHLRHF